MKRYGKLKINKVLLPGKTVSGSLLVFPGVISFMRMQDLSVVPTAKGIHPVYHFSLEIRVVNRCFMIKPQPRFGLYRARRLTYSLLFHAGKICYQKFVCDVSPPQDLTGARRVRAVSIFF
jgi:hypothetical protein